MSTQRELELKILAAVRSSPRGIRKLAEDLEAYEFKDVAFGWIWKCLTEFGGRDETPTRLSLEARALAAPVVVRQILLDALAEFWEASPTASPEADAATLREYHAHDAVNSVLDRATKALIRGDVSGAVEMMARASAIAPSREGQRPPWPTLDPAALYGLAGDIVRAIEPHTEGDPVGLLLQLLAAFGNVIGRTAYFKIEGVRHYTNLFVVLVGETAKARKGTSWGRIFEIVNGLDEKWATTSGLSTGEGLISAVRDEVTKETRNKDGEMVVTIVDEGVDDKRLLAFEPEFTRTLRTLSRDGNILSPVLREAWDSGTLSTITRANPLKATDAHISIIGHATRDELVKLLPSSEIAGGSANRFLFPVVRRTKLLPYGGQLTDAEVETLRTRTKNVVERAKQLQRVMFGDKARRLWGEIYPALSEGRSGLVGRITSRGEAQTIRLAVVYAALDGSAVISQHHLRAALAVWTYADASAQWIFGSQTGNTLSDRIREVLQTKPDGISLAEVWQLASRHGNKQQIDDAIRLLEANGDVRREQRATGGRPGTVLVPIRAASSASFASFASQNTSLPGADDASTRFAMVELDVRAEREHSHETANEANEATPPATRPSSRISLDRMRAERERTRMKLGDDAKLDRWDGIET